MKHSQRWIIFTLVIASLLLSACAEKPKAPAKVPPAVVETVEGSKLNRVTLTQKAAERLGIKTETVREEMVTRKRTVGGTIVDASSLSTAGATVPVTGSDGMFVSVRLTENDRSMFDASQPVHVRSLSNESGDAGEDDMLSEPFEVEDADEPGDVDAPMYFKLNGSGAKLSTGENVFVEFALKGSAAPQKIVPYSAVVYDLEGNTWVYTSPSSLVFTRHPVTVDYIDGDVAVLLDGPAAGSQVATVGVPELYGIDTGVNK